jgi:prepilin signal peptidase PulO-like enzyme (type II secretory pathway)
MFTFLAFLAGLCAGTFATRAIERLPVDDEFHHQIFASEEEQEPPEWWMRIPFIWCFRDPPGHPPMHWYDRLPLLPHFIYSWRFSNFRKLTGPARCAHCQRRLRLAERIPLVSYVIQRGRCANPECRIKIPGRHLVVELATGLLLALFAARFGPSLLFLLMAFLVTTFVIGSVIDWRYQIIPDEINSLSLILCLSFVGATHAASSLGILTDAALAARVGPEYPYLYSGLRLDTALAGLLVGAGALYLFAEIGGMLARTDAMGGGDVKLAGTIGAVVGPLGALATIFYAALIAAPCGLMLLMLGRGKKEGGFTKFAFGPYIAMGAGLVLYHGHTRMFDAYLAVNNLVVSFLASRMV